MSEIKATVVDFIKVLRNNDIKVSPAETLDAMDTMHLVGLKNRTFLRTSLAMALSKTPDEKEAFFRCFDDFFNFSDSEPQNGNDADLDLSFERDLDEKISESSGGNGGSTKQEPSDLAELDPAEESSLEPESRLGKLLLLGSRSEVLIEMIEAGRAVKVNEIIVFTQKGLYTRKIMDHMGLKGLQEEVKELKNGNSTDGRNLAKRLDKSKEIIDSGSPKLSCTTQPLILSCSMHSPPPST